MPGTGLPNLPGVEGVTPLVDLSSSAGAGERATAAALEHVGNEFARVAQDAANAVGARNAQRDAAAAAGRGDYTPRMGLTEAGRAYNATIAQAHQVQLRSKADTEIDGLANRFREDPEGYAAATAKFRSGFVTGLSSDVAIPMAGYVDSQIGRHREVIQNRRAAGDVAVAQSAITARAAALTTRITDAVLASGQGVAGLNDPHVVQDLAELTALRRSQLDNPGLHVSPEEVQQQIDTDLRNLQAAAISGHALTTFNTMGRDAALREVAGLTSGGMAPNTFITPSTNGTPEGLVAPGNIDLSTRPVVRSSEGASTVRSITIEADGRHILIPTVSDDGRIMTNEEARAHFRETGANLGSFDTEAHADTYAQALHVDQEHAVARGDLGLSPSNRLYAQAHALDAVNAASAAQVTADREARAAQEQGRADMTRRWQDGVAGVALTGHYNGPSEDEIRTVLGADGVREMYMARARAAQDHQDFGDLSRLSPEAAAERIRMVLDRRSHPSESLSTGTFSHVDNETDFANLMHAMQLAESGGQTGLVSRDPDGAGPAGGGAVGSSQILPDTARRLAGELGIPYDPHRLLNDREYGMQLQRRYMQDLLTRYQGNVLLAVTAYHAGEGNVDRWRQQFGDPAVVGEDAWLARVRDAGNPRSAEYPTRVAHALQGGRAWTAWGDATNLRATDPAAAVAGDPMVRAAFQRWEGDNAAGHLSTGSGYAAVVAFEQAQARAGIRRRDVRPLPNANLDPYVTRYAAAVALSQQDHGAAVLQFQHDVMTQFQGPIDPTSRRPQGSRGRQVLQAILTLAGNSVHAAAITSDLTSRVHRGEPLTVGDAQAARHDAGRAQSAVTAATGTQPAPEAPTAQDIATLRGNPTPEVRRYYDLHFGPGAASRLLGN